MYTLKKAVPKRRRFSIYKKALELYKSSLLQPKKVYGLDFPNGAGLCLVLPCILWNLRSYISYMPNGEDWDYLDTPKAFPEIAPYITIIQRTLSNKKTKKRIEVLEEIISKYQPKA